MSHLADTADCSLAHVCMMHNPDHCLAKAFYSLARRRSANCLSVIPCGSCPPPHIYRDVKTELSTCVQFVSMLQFCPLILIFYCGPLIFFFGGGAFLQLLIQCFATVHVVICCLTIPGWSCCCLPLKQSRKWNPGTDYQHLAYIYLFIP